MQTLVDKTYTIGSTKDILHSCRAAQQSAQLHDAHSSFKLLLCAVPSVQGSRTAVISLLTYAEQTTGCTVPPTQLQSCTAICTAARCTFGKKEGSSSRLLPEVMTLDTPTPSSSLSKKTSSLVRRGRHSKSTPPSTAATPSPQEPGDEPQQSLPTDTAKSLQMDLDQASHLTAQAAGTSTHSCQQQSQPVLVDDSVNLQIPETPLAPPQNTNVLAIPHNEVTLIPESPVPSSLPDPDPTHSPRSLPTSPRGAPSAHRTRAHSSPPQNRQKRNKATANKETKQTKLVLSPNANVYSSIVQHVASSISIEPSKESSGIPKKRHGKKANS